MAIDLESNPDQAADLCRSAFQRLLESVAGLTDGQMADPSRLPQWSVGHVLTHLARNADGHGRRLQGALDGMDVPKYAGGAEQRAREIEDGADRRAEEIIADLEASQRRLEDLFTQSSGAGWPNPQTADEGDYGARACPAHRLREVEMHQVDLGLGYQPANWSDDYVEWDLSVLLTTVPERLQDPVQRRELMAWLAGRAALPSELTLDAWR